MNLFFYKNYFLHFFSYLLRGLGAIYIKRKIDGTDGKKDYIYRGLLQSYLQESLRSGHHIEFFIEGGRTRTGKPGIPKVILICQFRSLKTLYIKSFKHH